MPIAVVSAGAQVPGWIERAPSFHSGGRNRSALGPCGSSPVFPAGGPTRKGRKTPLFEQLEPRRLLRLQFRPGSTYCSVLTSLLHRSDWLGAWLRQTNSSRVC